MLLVQNLVMLAVGAGLRLVLRKKLAARICGLILVLGWAVLEIIADFAARTEGMSELLTGLSITWGPRFLMAMLGFLLTSLICRLLKNARWRDLASPSVWRGTVLLSYTGALSAYDAGG